MNNDLNVSYEEALEIIETYRACPSGLYEDWFGDKPWALQIEILDAVFKYSTVAVKSCHGTGKSFNAARIALAFLITHPGSIVITTAPTWPQVADVIWRELGAAYESSRVPIGGRLKKTGLDFGQDWYAIGRSTSKADNFVGYHADFILVIIDEAAGVEENIYEGIRGVTSNRNAKTLYIGNPTSGPESTFAKAFKNPYVKQFTISAFDTPNFIANDIRDLARLLAIFTPPAGADPLEHLQAVKNSLKMPYSGLVDPAWVYERYLEWGPESPMWQARVLGDFPSQAENSLIPLNLIEASMDPDYLKEHNWQVEDGPLEYGIDVARYGSDKTVIAPRRGGYVEKLREYARQDTVMTTDKVIESLSLEDWRATIKIDDSTMGGGVTDQLRRRKQDNEHLHFSVVPILFNNKPNRPEKFYDKRAEMYWTVRERFFNHAIALPKDDELASQLASVRYEITAKGLIKIEQKDEIKKRTGKSPDKADALVLAFDTGGVGLWSTEVSGLPVDQAVFQPTTSGLQERY